ncbi:hypothetical protein D6D01_10120 [Aureobasidium pullulans]|uniref:Uncharacterized protein n=1 Tax=Aureobasidium pullulans TaxID=5580 RepID=A0A4S9JQR8_AURPU|nr:hypothetical protein D6D01_10120 [Aureobasidium pullulans]
MSIVSLIDKLTTSGAANLAQKVDIDDRTKELREAKAVVKKQQDTIGSLIKENKALVNTVGESSTANAALQQDYHTLEQERNTLVKAQKTILERGQDDLSEARKHKESLEEELGVQKETKRIAEEKLTLLESTSNGTARELGQELIQAKQQLNRSEEEVTKLKKEKAAAEKEKAESDEAIGVLQAEKDQLAEDKKEMQQKWEKQLQNKLEGAQKKSEDHRDEAETLRVKLKNSTEEWSRTLMEVLAAGFTGNDIDSKLIRPILAPELSNVTDLEAEESPEYLFAERYINPNAAPEPTPEDVTTVDLIRWSKNLAVPPGLTNNDLDQIVWLEKHLLESIRKRQKQGSPVLLAFQILLNKVKSKDWLARCISCVRLAVLGGQYVMKDVEAWAKLVGDLRGAYPQLDADPLAQACIAKLALTTNNKTSHMCQALAEAYGSGGFDKDTLIPSIIALLQDDGVVHETVGEIELVMVRFQRLEVVFSRSRGHHQWQCSLQPIKITIDAVDKLRMKLTWGPGPEHTITFRYPGTPLYEYIYRHYGTTTLAAIRVEANRQLKIRLAAVLNAANSLSDVD